MLKFMKLIVGKIFFKMNLTLKLTIQIKNSLITSVNEVKQYDTIYENLVQTEININNNETF
jgi:hypothetical protein